MSLFKREEEPKKEWQARYYQEEAVFAAVESLEKIQKALVVMATGTGKNFVLNQVALYFIQTYSDKVLIICDRDELIEQLYQTAVDIIPGHISKEKAEDTYSAISPAVVASVQSLKPDRLSKFKNDYFGLIIIDECHKMMTPSYINILKHFPNAKVLGLTATPERSDDNQLGDFFPEITYQYNLAEGIRDKFLSKIIGRRLSEIDINIDDLKFGGEGSLNKESEKTIERRVLSNIDSIVDAIYTNTRGQKTLMFLPSVMLSDLVASKLREKGLPAESISYKTDKKLRPRLIADFKSGKITHLSNATLLSVGFDCPDIMNLVIARPCNSRVLYSQMIGRGTRIAAGKEHLTVYELTFNSTKHSLSSTWGLFQTGKDGLNISEKLIRKVKDKTPEGDLFGNIVEELNKELKYTPEELVENNIRKRNEEFKFVEYDPLAMIDMLGLDWNAIKYNNSKLRGLATPNQINFLRKFKIQIPPALKKAQAALVIDLIVQNKYSTRNLENSIVEKIRREQEELKRMKAQIIKVERKERP